MSDEVKSELVEEAPKRTRGPDKQKRRKYNTENLKPLSERTPEEVHAITSAGAKASAESKRRKKELRELARDFLLQDASEPLKANLKKLGFEADDMTNLAAVVGVMFSKTINGDLAAARNLIEWAGMSTMQQIRENEAAAKLEQFMSYATVDEDKNGETEDVVFYLPENGR